MLLADCVPLAGTIISEAGILLEGVCLLQGSVLTEGGALPHADALDVLRTVAAVARSAGTGGAPPLVSVAAAGNVPDCADAPFLVFR